MTICCPKSIKACAIRVTRQNNCDVVLDPLAENSRVLSSGFMELNLSPDVEDGNDITTKNACGDICIRDKDCDRLKGFEVELKLCGIPLPMVEMLIDATLIDDGSGNFVGAVMRESKSAPCAYSKQLELWSKNAAKTCNADGSTSTAYIQWVLPLTKNWELSGGLNFTMDALELTLKGYAENNPNWFPSMPGSTFPSWVPGGGDPAGSPDGAPSPVLPDGVDPDDWSLTDQAAIQAGGPLAWRCVDMLPSPLDDCAYMPSTPASA